MAGQNWGGWLQGELSNALSVAVPDAFGVDAGQTAYREQFSERAAPTGQQWLSQTPQAGYVSRSSGVDNQTLMIGAAVVGVGLVAVMVLK